MSERLRNRLLTDLLFVATAWPLYTFIGSVLEARLLPYQMVSWGQAFVGALAGTALLLPEMAIIGACFVVLSWAVFRRRGCKPHWSEPAALFVSLTAGAAFWHPGILARPLFLPGPNTPAWAAMAALIALAGALVFVSGRPGARAPLAVTMLSIGLLAPLPVVARAQVAGSFGDAPRLVILGLDSLSHADDLSTLRAWVRRERGAWYERAVTPGLLTNAVWASIMTGRPISDHGVFETFQSLTPESATLIREASAQGYRTVSFFPDQLTCAVGIRKRASIECKADQSGGGNWYCRLSPTAASLCRS